MARRRSRRRSTEGGMSLIEVMVALLLLTLILIAFLGILDTSSRVAKVQGNLSDATENLRFSVAALVRIVRMAGTGGLPLVYRDGGGALQPLAIEVSDNVDGTASYGGKSPIAGTDVLEVRGVISGELYDVGPAAVDLTNDRVVVPETSPFSGTIQALDYPPSFNGRTVMVALQTPLDIAPSIGGVRHYSNYRLVNVAAGNTAVAVTDPDASTAGDATMTVTFVTDGSAKTLNPGGAYSTFGPSFAYAFGFVDDLLFFIAENDAGAPSLYRFLGTGNAEELVPNISSLQIALGCDVNRDGALAASEWFLRAGASTAPTGDQLMAAREIRISLVARSAQPDMTWTANPTMPENAAALTGDDLSFRYRTVTVRVSLRSHPPLVAT